MGFDEFDEYIHWYNQHCNWDIKRFHPFKKFLYGPCNTSPTPAPTHTSDLWQSLVFFSVAIAYLGVSHKWNHSVLDDLMLLRILVHSFLQQIGIPFLWLCHKVYPFLLVNFKRTVLSYRQVGQRKVKRVNRKIFIIDVIIS